MGIPTDIPDKCRDLGTGRLGEEVTLRQSQRGRLKNCTSSFETGHRKGKETPWGGGS